MKNDIKSRSFVKKLDRTRWYWTVKNVIKDFIRKTPEIYPIIDDRNEMEDAEQILIAWPNECRKPKIGLVQDWKVPPYWTRYERFLRNNQIPFEYYDIHRSDWLAISKQFDVILWATTGISPDVDEHKRKTYTLEKYCGIDCLPSFDTLMWNEDKIFQYEWLRIFNFPVVDTFISHSFTETMERIKQSEYPLVSKTPIGAGSLGVELIKNEKQAARVSRQAFSAVGRTTYWPIYRQKDFVYYQKFQPNEGYDLRVIAVGDRAFGYYRDVPKDEFRASGMGLVRKGALPEDAVHLAMQLIKQLDLIIASVDMLRDLTGKLHIIEVSANITVETPGQLHVDGVPGAYVFDSSGIFHFEPCKLWMQELALLEFFKRWIIFHIDKQL